jgi:hypothetical protein
MFRQPYLQMYFAKHPESLPYLERLLKEWNKHDRIIIACDFDDTIRHWSMTNDFNHIISVIKEAQQLGALLVINTASDVDARRPLIEEYCKDNGLCVDSINENPIDLPYGKWGKVYANIYLDDRAGLNEAINILEYATLLKKYQFDHE